MNEVEFTAELELKDITHFQFSNENIYILRKFNDQSQLVKLDHLMEERWVKNLKLSYTFLKFGKYIYATEKEYPQRTAVILASDGEIIEISDRKILHIPPMYLDDKCFISFATYNNLDSFVMLNKLGKVKMQLSPSQLDKAKVLNSDSYISFINNQLKIYYFEGIKKTWSTNCKSIIDLQYNLDVKRLRLNQVFNFADFIILKFNDNKPDYFLLSIDKKTGKLIWILRELPFVGTNGEFIFGATQEQTLYKIELKTGEIVKENKINHDSLNITNGMSFQAKALIFKDDHNGKIGFASPENLEITNIVTLPKGYQFEQYKYPHIHEGRAYCHSPLNGKFCIIKL